MDEESIKLIKLFFVNAFLVRMKEGFVLIDAGMASYWKKLEKELISAGCLPDKLKLVILTHGDSDHAGNCRRLQERYGSKIAMHQDDGPIIREPVLWQKDSETLRYADHILDSDISEEDQRDQTEQQQVQAGHISTRWSEPEGIRF